jgi:fructose-1,6-bisphosphatase I
MSRVITLGQFIIEKQSDFPFAKGGFSRLIRDLGIAAKIVNREVNKAGLVNILGETGDTNVQGEQVKKLDVYANDQFIAALQAGGECCMIVSEENDDVIPIQSKISEDAKYIVCIDPLDGSSNIDVNVSVGTIFAIYRRLSDSGYCTMEEAFQSGKEMVAAGYVIYGSSTMFVYSTGKGVNGFTLDPSIGEFCLSHPNMQIPENGKLYSINEGNYVHFPDGVKKYLKYCQEIDEPTNRPYTSRYIGSMVADFHRNMLKGGIFIYPSSYGAKNGKLRLIYECNPLSYLIEQAGGKASDGLNRILDLPVNHLHQRTPVFIGSKAMVEKAEEFMAKHSPVEKIGN